MRDTPTSIYEATINLIQIPDKHIKQTNKKLKANITGKQRGKYTQNSSKPSPTAHEKHHRS